MLSSTHKLVSRDIEYILTGIEYIFNTCERLFSRFSYGYPSAARRSPYAAGQGHNCNFHRNLRPLGWMVGKSVARPPAAVSPAGLATMRLDHTIATRFAADEMAALAAELGLAANEHNACLFYTSPSTRDRTRFPMPSSA